MHTQCSFRISIYKTGLGSNPVGRGLENLSGSHICKANMPFFPRLNVSWSGLGVLMNTEGGNEDFFSLDIELDVPGVGSLGSGAFFLFEDMLAGTKERN